MLRDDFSAVKKPLYLAPPVFSHTEEERHLYRFSVTSPAPAVSQKPANKKEPNPIGRFPGLSDK